MTHTPSCQHAHSDDSLATSFLRALPKCEMHLHIEGTLEPKLVFALSKANNIALPELEEYANVETLEERYKRFTSLDDFLNFYNRAMAVLITPSDYEALAYAYMLRAHEDGIAHAEVFFDPQSHTERGIDLSVVVGGIQAGLKQGEQDFGITTKLIMCFVRHLSVASAKDAVASMEPYVKSGDVVGVGMDSTEKGNPPEKYAEVYDLARKLGFPNVTAHVGEEGPASEVRTAVEKMGIRRIDHGIHASDDPELLKVLAAKGVFLTVCPISNVQLRCVTKVAEVPIPQFMAAGVKFCINSDDPAYFGGYLLDNYVAVHEAFGFTKEVWKGLMQDSIDGTWCDAGRKAQLSAQLEAVMTAWEGKDI